MCLSICYFKSQGGAVRGTVVPRTQHCDSFSSAGKPAGCALKMGFSVMWEGTELLQNSSFVFVHLFLCRIWVTTLFYSIFFKIRKLYLGTSFLEFSFFLTQFSAPGTFLWKSCNK